MNFTSTVLCLFVGYSSLNSLKDWNIIQRKCLPIFALMACYGLFTWVIQYNPLYEIVNTSFEKTEMWAEVQDRGYRVFSSMNNPIAYGAVMGMVTLYLTAGLNSLKTKIVYGILLLVLLNVLFSYSRSAIVGLILGFLVFIFLKYRITVKLLGIILGCVCLTFIAYLNIPSIQSVVDLLIDIALTGGQSASGSNIELKDIQLETSLLYFSKSPFLGNGFRFFQEELLSGNIVSYDGSLAGLEGYLFVMLVENGIFMIVAICIFFIQLLCFVLKRIRYGTVAYLGVAWIVYFLFFIYITGIYGNVFLYYMTFIGLIIKYLQLYDVLYFNSSIQRRSIHTTLSR